MNFLALYSGISKIQKQEKEFFSLIDKQHIIWKTELEFFVKDLLTLFNNKLQAELERRTQEKVFINLLDTTQRNLTLKLNLERDITWLESLMRHWEIYAKRMETHTAQFWVGNVMAVSYVSLPHANLFLGFILDILLEIEFTPITTGKGEKDMEIHGVHLRAVGGLDNISILDTHGKLQAKIFTMGSPPTSSQSSPQPATQFTQPEFISKIAKALITYIEDLHPSHGAHSLINTILQLSLDKLVNYLLKRKIKLPSIDLRKEPPVIAYEDKSPHDNYIYTHYTITLSLPAKKGEHKVVGYLILKRKSTSIKAKLLIGLENPPYEFNIPMEVRENKIEITLTPDLIDNDYIQRVGESIIDAISPIPPPRKWMISPQG